MSPSINPPPQFTCPNPFQPLSIDESLVEPEYGPLGYIDVDISSLKSSEWIPTRALIDSGGQGSFINDKLVKRYPQIPTRPKSTPISLVLADGCASKGGDIIHYSPLVMRIGDNEEEIGLDIAPTTHHIVLGTPWLRKHDPAISYSRSTISFHSQYCQEHCLHYNKTFPLHPDPSPNEGCPPIRCQKLGDEATQEKKGNEPTKALPPRGLVVSRTEVPRKPQSMKTVDKPKAKNVIIETVPEPSVEPQKPVRKPPRISIIGPHAFARLCNQPGVELCLMTFRPAEVQINNTEANPKNQVSVSPLANVPVEYHDLAELFSEDKARELPPHRPYDHRISLEPGTTPPFGPIYSMSPLELEALKKYCEENLKKGFIRHSQSPCASPILFVKKLDGTLRLCVDYRGLNKITIKNRYPLPLIGELLDRISKAKYFTKFDVRDGYHRLRMAEGEEWKTAFRCRYGLFEYTVMPFGLCNAPGTFQHYMNDTFREFLDQFLIVYLDDLLIYSETLEEHKKHVRLVMEKLRDAGLYLKPSKCQFHTTEVSFLGYVVGPNGVKMDPSKVEAITSWPTPTSVHDIRVFLGLANFYRRFIEKFSKIAAPITYLLKKDKKFRWTTSAQKAFEELKEAFTSAPILHHFDPSLPTVLEADASQYALGTVISQRDPADGKLHPITFYSRKFNPAEENYEIYDREMLAIVETLDHYRHYFEGLGQKVTIFSDHNKPTLVH